MPLARPLRLANPDEIIRCNMAIWQAEEVSINCFEIYKKRSNTATLLPLPGLFGSMSRPWQISIATQVRHAFQSINPNPLQPVM